MMSDSEVGVIDEAVSSLPQHQPSLPMGTGKAERLSVESNSSSALFNYQGLDDDQYEDLWSYKYHGLHPVVLGDVLPKRDTCIDDPAKEPRYRIHLKIGFGAFSTVWLGFDLEQRRFVAVKVCRGNDETYSSTEAQILRSVRETQTAILRSPGSENVVSLYDAFVVRGPNGHHQCLVTEVLLPWTGLERQLWREFDHRNIIKQLATGFAFLHQQGIVHGDPTVANIGLAAPQIERFAEFDLSEELGIDLSAVPVMTVDPSLPPDTVPAYMINAVSLTRFLSDNNLLSSWQRHDLKVMDFGRAFWITKPRQLLGACPSMYRPPEIAMHKLSGGVCGSTWNQAADVWAVANLFFKIETGRFIFQDEGTLEHQIVANVKLATGGPVPHAWSNFCPELQDLPGSESEAQRSRSHDTTTANEPGVDPETAWNKLAEDHGFGACDPRLLRLIRRMLALRPEERPSMAEVLEDPYMADVI